MNYAPIWVLPIAAMLVGCAANPDQAVYVMPAPTGLNAGLPAPPGSLALKVRSVTLPDYLDTTDLVTRTGQYQIEASRTARWGERLSNGVTRALAIDLSHRLQAHLVADESAETPSVQIEVTVSAFDVTAATSVLAASWTVAWEGDRRMSVNRHGTFTTGIAQPGGDMAVVAAMADSVAQLSDRIAATARADAADHLNLALRK